MSQYVCITIKCKYLKLRHNEGYQDCQKSLKKSINFCKLRKKEIVNICTEIVLKISGIVVYSLSV